MIAVLIHGRTVNVLQNKYFEPKYEGIDTQGYITYKSRYQLYKSIGDILVKKAKLTKMETEAIIGDGSNTSYILDGDKVNDYLEEHYFDLIKHLHGTPLPVQALGKRDYNFCQC
ncbi:hypothetical protein ACW185_01205 [Limosilactobacillus fermentum]